MYKYKVIIYIKIEYYLQIKETEASSMRLSGEGSTWQAEDSSLDQKTPAKGIGAFYVGR